MRYFCGNTGLRECKFLLGRRWIQLDFLNLWIGIFFPCLGINSNFTCAPFLLFSTSRIWVRCVILTYSLDHINTYLLTSPLRFTSLYLIVYYPTTQIPYLCMIIHSSTHLSNFLFQILYFSFVIVFILFLYLWVFNYIIKPFIS